MTVLRLYHRPACHLCEQMLAALYGTYGDELEVELVDIDRDPLLQARFGTRIPVLAAGEKVLCEVHLDTAAVDAYFGLS